MNAPAKILSGKSQEDTIWLLETRALIRSFLEYEYQFEHLADAIDPLQEYAEQSGLVAALGQDEVQRLIAAPFERFRSIVAAELEAEQEPSPDLPSDYGAQLVRQWELADPRDRWRWTGESPPKPEPQAKWPAREPYRTTESTIDAFLYVARTESTEYLAEWLERHPLDAPFLRKLAEERCANQ